MIIGLKWAKMSLKSAKDSIYLKLNGCSKADQFSNESPFETAIEVNFLVF